jgi:head-tail adaptor
METEKAMRAGKLDRLVTVEKKETTQDAVFGTPIVTWVPLVALPGSPVVAERFWAEIQDALPSRSEAVTQGLALARNQTRLRMRWRDDINSSMRVTVHGDSDVVYQIVAGPADIDGRKSMIEMVLEKFSS